MALVKCRECGHDVSTEAEKCPNCGVPAPQPKPKPKERLGGEEMLLILFIILGILFVLGWLINQFDSDSNVEKKRAEQEITTDSNSSSDNKEQSQESESSEFNEADKASKAGVEKKIANNKEFVVIATVLNVRKEPNATSEIVGKLNKGSIVYVDTSQVTSEWVAIKQTLGGEEFGYVKLSYLLPQASITEARKSSPYNKLTKGGYFACISESTLDEAAKYSARNDLGALQQLVAGGECIILKEGIEVTIEDASFFSGTVVIRPVGTRLKLWTVREAVE